MIDQKLPLNIHNIIWLLIVSIAQFRTVYLLDNGLALTPPMGWLAWERYVCETNCDLYPGECIDDNLFLEMGTRMVEDGFRQLGYEYVNIDDCWSVKKRNNVTNLLEPDPTRFKLPIETLSDKLHSMGLKLGIYGDCGTETCQNYPGQLKYRDNLTDNYFQLDSQLFAKWKIDSFKFDGCYLNVTQASKICPLMGLALNETKQPMLFSCSWPAYENDEKLETNWTLVVERCNLWRSFGDIEDSWKSVLETIDWFVRKQDLIVKYHGPGHWFDADQLVIGNFGLSLEQERAQMAIWSIWASPLYMSNDLRNLNKESSKILRNKWIISVNQDKFGIFGLMVHEYRYLQVFIKPVEPIIDSCPSYAIVYLDRRTLGNGRINGFKLSMLLSELHEKLDSWSDKIWSRWSNCPNRTTNNVTYDVHDLYDNFNKLNRSLSLQSDELSLRVNPSGVRMVKLVQNNKLDENSKAGQNVNNSTQAITLSNLVSSSQQANMPLVSEQPERNSANSISF